MQADRATPMRQGQMTINMAAIGRRSLQTQLGFDSRLEFNMQKQMRQGLLIDVN